MKAFLGFVRKETLHLLRDRQTLGILILFPVLQVLIFGFAVRTDVRDIALAVDPNAISAAVKVTYIETLDPPPGGDGREVRIVDEESSSILAVNLEYLPIPVVWTAN